MNDEFALQPVPCADLAVSQPAPLVGQALHDLRALGDRAEAWKLYEEARRLADEEQLVGAVVKCEEALAKDEHFAPAAALAGRCCAELHRPAEAEAWAHRALAEDPHDAVVAFYCGCVWQELQQQEPARRIFLRCLELDPGFFRAHCRLANLAIRDDQWAAALEWSRRTLACNPCCHCACTKIALCGLSLPKGTVDTRETLEAGLEGNPVLGLSHKLHESLYPAGAAGLEGELNRFTDGPGHLPCRRILYAIRDANFEKALAEAEKLVLPAKLAVLRHDLSASLHLRLAAQAAASEERAAHRLQATQCLEQAEAALPRYWLTRRLSAKLSQ